MTGLNWDFKSAFDSLQMVPQGVLDNLPSVLIYAGISALSEMIHDASQRFIGGNMAIHAANGFLDTARQQYLRGLPRATLPGGTKSG